MFRYFYNESIRKIVVGFGSLFNDIHIARKDKNGDEVQRIRVPLTYGPKEKFIRRLEEQSSITDPPKNMITLPRLGFDMTGIQYDASRKINKLNKIIKREPGKNSFSSFSESPFNLSFNLYVFTRNIDDNLQIVEQIVPYFSPEFIVSIKLNELNESLDVPIVLNDVSMQEEYEGDFSTRRAIISTLTFTCKTSIYQRIDEGKIIVKSNVNMFDIVGATSDVADFIVRAEVTGSTADYSRGPIIYVE